MIFRYWRGLSTYNNEHFELFSLAWLFPHFTRYFTSSWNLQLQFPRNSCCGIALVRVHARTSLLVCFPEAAAAPHFPAQSQPFSPPLSSCDLRFTSAPHFTSAIPVCSPPA